MAGKRNHRRGTKPDAGSPAEGTAPGGALRFWRTHRRELTFVGLFLALLAGSFALLSVHWVDQNVVVPFTTGVASLSGITLELMGQEIERRGTYIFSDRFSVNIENGCNGVEAMLIFFAAVLAFPARWGARLAGLALGFLAIQVVNLIRVVGLYLTGAYLPEYFDATHTVVGQTVVILASILLWLAWVQRFATPPQAPAAAEGR